MRRSAFFLLAKAATFAAITYIILTLVIGSLHLSLYEGLPQDGPPALLTELGLLALSLTPAIWHEPMASLPGRWLRPSLLSSCVAA